MKRSTTSDVTATTTLPVGVPVVVDADGETLSLTFFTRPPNCAAASCGTTSAASVRARRFIPWRRRRRAFFLTWSVGKLRDRLARLVQELQGRVVGRVDLHPNARF